jgi:predicted CXXCH cytochrome family protein
VSADGKRHASRLRLPKEEVCLECHDDMSAEGLAEEGEVLHSPAEEGECVECHDPHKARYASLLRVGDPFEKLCFQCHDPEDVLDTGAHEGLAVAERKCVRCHDPHVSNREYLLKAHVARRTGS